MMVQKYRQNIAYLNAPSALRTNYLVESRCSECDRKPLRSEVGIMQALIILSVIGLSMAVCNYFCFLLGDRSTFKPQFDKTFPNIPQALDIPDHLQAPMKVLRKACLAESGVDEKYVEQSKNGYMADVPELKCYVLCLLEHAGVASFFFYGNKSGFMAKSVCSSKSKILSQFHSHLPVTNDAIAIQIEADNTIHFDDIMHLLPQSNKDSVNKAFDACKTIRK